MVTWTSLFKTTMCTCNWTSASHSAILGITTSHSWRQSDQFIFSRRWPTRLTTKMDIMKTGSGVIGYPTAADMVLGHRIIWSTFLLMEQKNALSLRAADRNRLCSMEHNSRSCSTSLKKQCYLSATLWMEARSCHAILGQAARGSKNSLFIARLHVVKRFNFHLQCRPRRYLRILMKYCFFDHFHRVKQGHKLLFGHIRGRWKS